MADPSMVVTGATGFIGRHVLEALHREYDIWALSRSSPRLRGVSMPASVRWLPVDVARPDQLREAVDAIRRTGRPEILLHLAGHYDFTGQQDPEYRRTNVVGTRNVLEADGELGVRDVIFASSVAACAFPAAGRALTEASAPDGTTPYAESKRLAEAMLAEYRGVFRRWIVRFGAVFSDWCEYEPLFRFVETWVSRRPQSRILAGDGLSAIPYLHVRDAVSFVRCLLARREALDDGEVLLASTDGATSHLELFLAATGAHHGERARCRRRGGELPDRAPRGARRRCPDPFQGRDPGGGRAHVRPGVPRLLSKASPSLIRTFSSFGVWSMESSPMN